MYAPDGSKSRYVDASILLWFGCGICCCCPGDDALGSWSTSMAVEKLDDVSVFVVAETGRGSL